MKSKLLSQKLFSYPIYTIPCLTYGVFGTDGAGTTGILVFPTFIFSILLFFYDLAFTYLGQLIFRNTEILILGFLLPQIIGLFIFLLRRYNHDYILDIDSDIILWGFLIIMSILNYWTYTKLRRPTDKSHKG